MDNYIMEIQLGGYDGRVIFTRRRSSTLQYRDRSYQPTKSSQLRLEKAIEREINSGRAELGLRLPLVFVAITT